MNIVLEASDVSATATFKVSLYTRFRMRGVFSCWSAVLSQSVCGYIPYIASSRTLNGEALAYPALSERVRFASSELDRPPAVIT